MALLVILAYGVLYLLGVRSLRRCGHAWPRRFTAYFFVLGLGTYAWVSFGFLGTYSTELRWAFTTRVVLLLVVVPAGLSLGKPVALALIVLRGRPRRILRTILRSWPLRLISNAVSDYRPVPAGFCGTDAGCDPGYRHPNSGDRYRSPRHRCRSIAGVVPQSPARSTTLG
ncbi:MAG: cytochrome c oxidase assembly protein [Actinomycetales bacterium]|nr:cytochrome c oxidase assembly protein [Actinomycetales bacterium]